jgi:uncharacterized protein YjbI with pentapeptide repeats
MLRVGEMIGVVVAVVATIFSAWGLFVANKQTELAIQGLEAATVQSALAEAALQDQRISAAWQILAFSSPAATGKQYALRSLVELQDKLIGVDLSCAAMGGTNALGFCTRRPDLSEMTLARPQEKRVTEFLNANFEDTQLTNLRVERVHFYNTSFKNADLSTASFENVELNSIDFSGATFDMNAFPSTTMANIDFTRVNLQGTDFSTASLITNDFYDLPHINISGSTLCYVDPLSPEEDEFDLRFPTCAVGLTQDFFDHAWFYADNPPIIWNRGSYLEKFDMTAGCERNDSQDPVDKRPSREVFKEGMDRIVPLLPSECSTTERIGLSKFVLEIPVLPPW